MYLYLSVCTHVSTIINGESSLHIKSKNEINSVLNFRTGKLCSEVVSFWWSEIQVWQLSSNFVNFLPFGFYRCLTTEKHWCKPCRLPRIAYPFQLIGLCPLLNTNEMKGSLREKLQKKCDSQTIRRYVLLCINNMLLKVVCLSSASLAVHSNIIEELQKFYEVQNLKLN